MDKSSTSTTSPLGLILDVTKFIIFALLLISISMLFTSGGLIASYTIGIILVLVIISLCVYFNIENLGNFINLDFLTALWSLPIIMILVTTRKDLSEKTKSITDPLWVIMSILLILNFMASSILDLISQAISMVLRISNILLPILIGLVLATFIISVVFFWDKISTTVKIACVVIAILAGLFISNSENIIAYLATNKISLALNAIVIIGFGIVNYFLYKYTDNGLLSNVSQILSVLFIARWIYLYAFKFYGSSGVTTFTSATGPTTGSVLKPIRPPTDFYNYLTDINFYCETIKSLFTGIIKYFLLAVFLFYAWFTFYIYYKNSFEFLTTYKTLSILGFLTIGFILLLLVIYSLSGGSGVEQTSPYVAFISKIGAYFAGFAVVMGIIIYALSKIMSIPSTTVQIVSIVNFLLLMGLVALILSIFNFNTSSNLTISSNNGLGFIVDFIVKLVLYIPCFIIDCSNVLREQLQLAKKEYTVVIILLIEIALIASKFLIPKLFNTVINSDGVALTNKVYPLEMKSMVSIPLTMKLMNKNLNYGVSSWIYIHPVPNNTNEAYIQNTSLINCGNVPDIQFNAEKGALIFAIDVTDVNGGKRTVIAPDKKTGKDIKIIYSRWNHVYVNFMDGGMDVFINGDLVISEPNIIPYQNPNGVIIGSSPGIYGEMCSLVYYKTPVLAQNVKLMYESMKNMNPPVTV
jgi:hypothetical protein